MHTQILNKLFDFIVWIEPKIAVFPRNYRYNLGNRIENTLYDTMESLLQVRFSKNKLRHLYDSNTSIEKLRYYFRLCYKLKIVKDKSYEHLSLLLTEISTLLNNHIKEIK
ncbi:MAG TPA: four helix bundle protein [Candidatus Cloacimonetes bacterium]|nr:four helix bundle protein [Candidatus Cloacimonadota bacterium]HEX37419.1 four helix bundle protein [Candidatus Cloacimonadota bacterium]